MHLPNMRHRKNKRPHDSCRTQVASSHFRHNRQCFRRRGRWLGVALGYRQPWLPTCAIPSRHRPKLPGAHNFWHPRLNSAHRFQPAKRTKVRTWVRNLALPSGAAHAVIQRAKVRTLRRCKACTFRWCCIRSAFSASEVTLRRPSTPESSCRFLGLADSSLADRQAAG